MRKVESIITDDMESCYLCKTRCNLELHHCLHGTSNRKKADQDKLTVMLCHRCHHTLVHDNPDRTIDNALMQKAQIAWMRHNNKHVVDFIERYGKSYL